MAEDLRILVPVVLHPRDGLWVVRVARAEVIADFLLDLFHMLIARDFGKYACRGDRRIIAVRVVRAHELHLIRPLEAFLDVGRERRDV